MFADKVRSMLGVQWLMVFGAILAAWVVLYAMAIPSELREASRLFGADFWGALCTVTPDLAGMERVTLMWLLMSVAMMLPTVLPTFAAYDDLAQSAETDLPLFAAGFLSVWAGFSIIAAGLQMLFFRFDLVSAFGDSRSVWLTAGLLGIAGMYQFSTLKEACLSKCRAPVTFFLQHWEEGHWRMGLRLGVTCLGCCWALMLLAFVGGVMSLGFMGLATLIMTLEKLPDIGRWLNKPLGVALLGGAAWVSITGF